MIVTKKNPEINFIYLTLFFAIFNDIIRFGGELTLYRISLPFLIICVCRYKKNFKIFCFGSGLLLLLTIVQYLCTDKYIKNPIPYSGSWMFYYFLLYEGIFSLILAVRHLKQVDVNFSYNMQIFLKNNMVLRLILLIIGMEFESLRSVIYFANINNYAMSGAILLILVLCNQKHILFRKLKNMICFLVLSAIFLKYDNKAVLLGLFVIMGVYIILYITEKFKCNNIWFKIGLPICILLGVIIWIITAKPLLNGYSLYDMTVDAVKRIFTQEAYMDNGGSTHYRVDVIVMGVGLVFGGEIILGLGMGNFARFLGKYMKGYEGFNALSPHNAWLEFMIDFGTLAVILYITIIIRTFKLYVNRTHCTIEKEKILFVFSFPLWVMSASGIYTEYSVWIMIAYLLFAGYGEKFKYMSSHNIRAASFPGNSISLMKQ